MRQFFDLVIPLNIHGNIHPVIIRNPELITVRVVNPLRAVNKILTDRRRVRPTRAVSKII